MGGGGLPGARPARYLCANYPDINPGCTLPERSPPSRPRAHHCAVNVLVVWWSPNAHLQRTRRGESGRQDSNQYQPQTQTTDKTCYSGHQKKGAAKFHDSKGYKTRSAHLGPARCAYRG